MPKKSEVQNHFTPSNPENVECNYCLKEFKTAGGTTNRWKHLNKHVWEHFTRSTENNEKANCKYCSQEFELKMDVRTSAINNETTSNMMGHFKEFHKVSDVGAAASQPPPPPPPGSPSDAAGSGDRDEPADDEEEEACRDLAPIVEDEDAAVPGAGGGALLALQPPQQPCHTPPSAAGLEDVEETDVGAGAAPQARCKRCRVDTKKSGTSNLWNHMGDAAGEPHHPASFSSLPPPPPSQPQLLLSSERESGRLQEENEARLDLARMITLGGHDPSILEDEHFKRFVHRLNPEFQLPSRAAIEDMCDQVFDRARDETLLPMLVDDALEKKQFGFSLSVGSARTMAREVLYTACHYIDDEWKLCRVIVGDLYCVVPQLLSDIHGPILIGVREVGSVETVVNDFRLSVLYEYDIQDRLFMTACAVTDGDDGTLHKLIKDIITKKECSSLLTSQTSREEIFCATSINLVLHSIARCLLSESDLHRLEDYISGIIYDLELTRHELTELLSQLGLDDDPWDYNEPWYSRYCSLEIVCKKCPDATAYEIEKQVLRNIWGQIYSSIQRVSTSSIPTSNLCLAELFRVREALQSELDKGLPDDFADDLVKVKEVLDKAIQDSYLVWSIPLALDPRYKLEFIGFLFERMFDAEAARDYIAKVTGKIRDLYARYDHAPGVSVDSPADPLRDAWNERRRAQSNTDLDRYLRDESIPDPRGGFDILKWWKGQGSDQYPGVARMARDALAMPTSSRLSSEQIAHIRSTLRGYSKDMFGRYIG